MTDFILVNSDFDNVLSVISDNVPTFLSSKEYQTISDNKDLPGVVLAAFRKYHEKKIREHWTNPHDEEINSVLKRCFDVLETLASNKQQELINALMVEYFEGFQWDYQLKEEFESFAGPKLLSLLQEWMSRYRKFFSDVDKTMESKG